LESVNQRYIDMIETAIASPDVGVEMLYRNVDLSQHAFNDVAQYNEMCDQLGLPQLCTVPTWGQDFNIPSCYAELDVEAHVRALTPNRAESHDRVEEELSEFRTRNLFPVLRMLIYIVDVMRQHGVVWGVGRGSSVASYVLYLIGIHKVDSLKYNINIHEFLK